VSDLVRVSVVPLTEALSSGTIREKWLSLASESDNLRALHQTPSWCARKVFFLGERIDVAVLQDAPGEIIGLAPLQHTTFPLGFTIGKRQLWAKRFCGLLMMGNQPLLPSCMQTYDELFRAIRGTFPDSACLCMWGVPLDSYLWEYLATSGEIRAFWQRCLPCGGATRHHWLSLPSTFREYLAKFSAKSRHELKRHVNVLKRHGGGSLELVRVDSSHQVSEFVDDARAIAAVAWQQVFMGLPLDAPFDLARSLQDLADQNLLRAYVLRCGGRPCAYGLGFQLPSTYVFYETAYDPQFARHSPGRVLLFLMLQDLIDHNRPQRFSFGPGEFDYKAFFGNSVSYEANLVLFRRTLSNCAWCGSHGLFRGAVRAAKRLLGKEGERGEPENGKDRQSVGVAGAAEASK
jgi:CelD/BcsL family acetyltransferase involved in cellulose biosynthesis